MNETYIVSTDAIEDRSFNISGRDFNNQQQTPLDSSIVDIPLDDVVIEDEPITFTIVEGGTKRGGKKLVGTDGYTYTRMVKEIARRDVFKPAGSIVEEVMMDISTPDDPLLPKPGLLIRAANLHRQKLRPTDPTTLDFELDTGFVGEDFVVDDLRVGDQRHIICATDDQLKILQQATRWFVDGTFKIVKRPFYQLMTIHAFVRRGDDAKQVPLVYILMSRRSKIDYVAVLNSLRSRLGQPLVEWFMLDFEAAAWQAIREVFPGCVLKGCVFHWNQRLYRKIQGEGLSTSYTDRRDKYEFLRKVMSLPFLPSEQITSAFQKLYDQAAEVGGPVFRVVGYVKRTWIDGSMWKPLHWSVFRETVRTNNDVEGWHRRINSRAARADLGLYMLLPLLKTEARTVDLQIRLVSQHLLTRLHRARYARVHGALFDAWDQYEDGDLTTTQLLRRCSNITGLCEPTNCNDKVYEDDN